MLLPTSLGLDLHQQARRLRKLITGIEPIQRQLRGRAIASDH